MAASAYLYAGTAALQFLDARNKASAIERQSQFQAQQDRFNADLIDFQREDLLDRVGDDIEQRQKQVKQILGSQKAVLAARGIDVDSEFAEQAAFEERQIAVEDVSAIKNNAWRQALGLKLQSQNLRTQAKFTQAAGSEAASSTLTTGGLQALGTGSRAFLKK